MMPSRRMERLIGKFNDPNVRATLKEIVTFPEKHWEERNAAFFKLHKLLGPEFFCDEGYAYHRGCNNYLVDNSINDGSVSSCEFDLTENKLKLDVHDDGGNANETYSCLLWEPSV